MEEITKKITTAVIGGIVPREGRRKGATLVVYPNDLPPNIVLTCTGFNDVNALLTYIIIISNGNIDKMTTKVSRLTWFEEWFLFLELMNGKTLSSFKGASTVFNIKNDIVSKIFDDKLRQVLEARNSCQDMYHWRRMNI